MSKSQHNYNTFYYIIPLFLYSFDREQNNIVYVAKMFINNYPSATREFASKWIFLIA